MITRAAGADAVMADSAKPSNRVLFPEATGGPDDSKRMSSEAAASRRHGRVLSTHASLRTALKTAQPPQPVSHYLPRWYLALPVRLLGASGITVSTVMPPSSSTLAVPVVPKERYRSLPS